MPREFCQERQLPAEKQNKLLRSLRRLKVPVCYRNGTFRIQPQAPYTSNQSGDKKRMTVSTRRENEQWKSDLRTIFASSLFTKLRRMKWYPTPPHTHTRTHTTHTHTHAHTHTTHTHTHFCIPKLLVVEPVRRLCICT